MKEVNKELMLQVAKHIRANAMNFNMNVLAKENECETIACIAGWTILLKDVDSLDNLIEEHQGLKSPKIGWEQKARELLGLEKNQADHLFFHSHWPDKYKDRYRLAWTYRDTAFIAADLLEDIANGVIVLSNDPILHITPFVSN